MACTAMRFTVPPEAATWSSSAGMGGGRSRRLDGSHYRRPANDGRPADSWRTFVRRTSSHLTCRRRARSRRCSSVAVIPAASADSTGSIANNALAQFTNARLLCAWDEGSFRVRWRDAFRASAHCGANRAGHDRRSRPRTRSRKIRDREPGINAASRVLSFGEKFRLSCPSFSRA